jgi:Na+/proline symporter/signal transduction histidine kinase
MIVDLTTLFVAGLVYLSILFLVAYATDHGLVPSAWLQHPVTYILSLGVYATSWSYYGSVGYAEENGLLFLAIYLGVTMAFLLGPVLLEPILRVTREFQLASLADLFAFRYRSQFAGVLVTLFMLVGALPYIALQIRAVTESLSVLSDEAPPSSIAIGFVVTLTVFAILFGARHISPREKHQGLVAAIAFESLVKLVALLAVGIYAVAGVLGGFGGLGDWLEARPEALERLYQPLAEGPWSTLLFLSFAAAFLLPRQFHMVFTENMDPGALRVASWGFPLFLLLINLPILPILWAGQTLDTHIKSDYYVLAVALAQGTDWLTVMTFIGGLSAASAMVIVTTLSLSYMTLNHILLPASYPDPRLDLYRWLLWGRRLLIFIILLAGFAFYALLEHNEGLVQLGLVSFVAVAQFTPGTIGLLYWRTANRWGFVTGLLGGILVWYFSLLHPLLADSSLVPPVETPLRLMAASGLDRWEFATFASLAVNGLLFVVLSLVLRQSREEHEAANACCAGSLSPLTGMVAADSPEEFKQELASLLGPATATREVDQALKDLGLPTNEHRPRQLRHLRDQIEKNLSGLIGPAMAHVIVNQKLLLDPDTRSALAESVRQLESRLEASQSQMEGLAADLDRLRRHHRRILMDLPIGVCTVNERFEIILWNYAMEVITGIRVRDALDKRLNELPRPWAEILAGFARAEDNHVPDLETSTGGRRRWFNLHKAALSDAGTEDPILGGGLAILVEDRTALENLEAELTHSDRLASIGRLAAGVAHEIGNPVTAIASLAQLMRDEEPDGGSRESVDTILEQTRRITSILRTLSGFAHGSEARARTETVDLRAVAEDAIHLVSLSERGKKVSFSCQCPDRLNVLGNPQQLSQVVVNLLTNACDASGPGQEVSVRAAQEEGQVRIVVADAGEGIDEEAQKMVFEPFFTTKTPGQGTGLGLAVVYRIIEQHRGKIEIESQPGEGTRVSVVLPAA